MVDKADVNEPEISNMVIFKSEFENFLEKYWV